MNFDEVDLFSSAEFHVDRFDLESSVAEAEYKYDATDQFMDDESIASTKNKTAIGDDADDIEEDSSDIEEPLILSEYETEIYAEYCKMLEEGALGEVFVYERNDDGFLDRRKLYPHDGEVIDYENLQDLEMIIFDGGNNITGGNWKKIFIISSKTSFVSYD